MTSQAGPPSSQRRGRRANLSVLVVDDSALMRRLVADIIERVEGFRIAGYARDGLEALREVRKLKPDVVILDVQMPRMDGMETLWRIMTEAPRPVIVFSALTQRGAEESILALELGALDVLAKPSALGGDFGQLSRSLGELLHAAAAANVENLSAGAEPAETGVQSRPESGRRLSGHGVSRVVAVAASVGGPATLPRLLASVGGDFPAPLLMVQHMPEGFTASFAERLNERLPISVREGAEGDELRPGVAYLAPGGMHMRVTKERRLELGREEPRCGVRPAADELFESVARVYGREGVGVVLTGMGRDGTAGAEALRGAGGLVIAQDRSTSVVFGMPRSVIEAGACDEVLPVEGIGARLRDLCREGVAVRAS